MRKLSSRPFDKRIYVRQRCLPLVSRTQAVKAIFGSPAIASCKRCGVNTAHHHRSMQGSAFLSHLSAPRLFREHGGIAVLVYASWGHTCPLGNGDPKLGRPRSGGLRQQSSRCVDGRSQVSRNPIAEGGIKKSRKCDATRRLRGYPLPVRVFQWRCRGEPAKAALNATARRRKSLG